MSDAYSKITEELIAGNMAGVPDLCLQAVKDGKSAQDILDNALFPGMDVVGQRMKTGEMFIPEVLRSAKAMQAGLEVLKDKLADGGANAQLGVVVIGTVQGDMHDIGKNLVVMMLEGAGFKVMDLGTDVKPEQFVAAVSEHDATIVGMSALLTTTMPKMNETVQALTEAGLREKVKIIVGGAPVTPQFVEQIGADGYGADAGGAVDKAKELAAA
ncbi:MAG: cobalamin-binding protein [Deltaproteobacteria bacterium]|nr:MAG: cobalamin-binding protein [Deltaproteobacteria bacterium]